MFLPEAIVKDEVLLPLEDGGVQGVFVGQEEECPTDAKAGDVHVLVFIRLNGEAQQRSLRRRINAVVVPLEISVPK